MKRKDDRLNGVDRVIIGLVLAGGVAAAYGLIRLISYGMMWLHYEHGVAL